MEEKKLHHSWIFMWLFYVGAFKRGKHNDNFGNCNNDNKKLHAKYVCMYAFISKYYIPIQFQVLCDTEHCLKLFYVPVKNENQVWNDMNASK